MPADPTQLLIHVTGMDEPGITAVITKYFGDINAQIVDIEQAVVYNYLSLHFHVKVAPEQGDQLKTALESRLKDFSLSIQVKPVQGLIELPDPANRFVATIIANDVHPRFISEITSSIASLDANIDSIRKLNNGGLETIELVCSARGPVNLPHISGKLLGICASYPDVDLAVQRENLYRRSKRLIAFDMDSTLIQGEVIDELAKIHGCEEAVSEITSAAMEGKLDFKASLQERVALLKGLKFEDMAIVAANLKLTPGANTLIKALKRLGYKVAIISGGFTYFVNHLKETLGLHYAYANRMEFIDGVCTGKIEGVVVDAQRKADLLETIAQQEGISLDQVIAIGDGANDILMLKRAGLGIAFNAKEATRAGVGLALTKKSMTSILYLLGITDSEVETMGYKVSSLHSQKKAD